MIRELSVLREHLINNNMILTQKYIILAYKDFHL